MHAADQTQTSCVLIRALRICNNIRGSRVDGGDGTVAERLPRGAGWRLSGNSGSDAAHADHSPHEPTWLATLSEHPIRQRWFQRKPTPRPCGPLRGPQCKAGFHHEGVTATEYLSQPFCVENK